VKSTPATWLSGLRRAALPIFQPFQAVARRSHGDWGMLLGSLGCAATATGCLVAEAPEYGPPQQRPPVIQTQRVEPSPYELLIFNEDTLPQDINVPVRSEDAGDNLIGALFVDWQVPGQQVLIREKPVPASSFDDVSRSWTFRFKPDDRIDENCGHTLTLLLMHESNYDFELSAPKDNASWDVASVTWQLNVEPLDPNFIAICSTGESTR